MSEERPLPALRLADRLERLRPDEMILIDREGRVVGRGRLRRRQLLAYGTIGAACTYALVMAPVFGLAYTGLVAAYLGARIRGVRALNRGLRLLRAERIDEAERAVEVLERGGWRQRAMAAYTRAMIDARRSRSEEAVAATERCERLLTKPDRYLYVVYWGNKFVRASLLLELGRLAEAAPVIERAMAAPDGELYTTLKRGLEAHRAFAADRPDELGTDDQLHDRVRGALRYNHTGMTVALLGWAYERRGDAEMCAHLIAEVAPRCQRGVAQIEHMHPRVWAWLGPKLAALPAVDEEA